MGSKREGDAENCGKYDFQAASKSVFDFIKDPFQMWKSGRIDLQRIVLRLVFREPLVYNRETGFGTPTLSLPLEIAAACGADKKQMVHLLGKSWNCLETCIREWYYLLRGWTDCQKVLS